MEAMKIGVHESYDDEQNECTDNEMDRNLDVKHKIYLAVNHQPEFLSVRKDYRQPAYSYYHYNIARVKLSMGKGDKMAYPYVFQALMDSQDWDEKKLNTMNENASLQLVFNGPLQEWEACGPPYNGNINKHGVRLHVGSEELLSKLYSVCGYNLKLNISGHVYRFGFKQNQHFFLNKNKEEIALNVTSTGKTSEEKLDVIPEIFGVCNVTGMFTISLEWCGRNLISNGLTQYRRILSFTGTNLKIRSSTSTGYFFCHSGVLMEMSPVFTAMLKFNAAKHRKKEIILDEIDSDTMQAFMEYVHHRNLQSANDNCHICFRLFNLAHKYDISELELSTQQYLERKPIEWLTTTTAVELYSFAIRVPNGKNLAERAMFVMQRRRNEVAELVRLQRIPAIYFDLLNKNQAPLFSAVVRNGLIDMN